MRVLQERLDGRGWVGLPRLALGPLRLVPDAARFKIDINLRALFETQEGRQVDVDLES
ncbi:hypothetical protein GCM10023321_40530 [Pseudonocardia eucalypti]|uniref:Uncharacterized protein n=1 Tax=Pseudonocardia eucalypti TaxID=648755 RepID=A0ABP9QC75_9PSEU